MPSLAGLLVSMFAGLVPFFARFVALRAAAITAAITTFVLLTTGVYAALSLLASGIVLTFPPIVMTGVWMFVPDNVVGCMTAIAATDAACALYRWNVSHLHLAAFTN